MFFVGFVNFKILSFRNHEILEPYIAIWEEHTINSLNISGE